MVSHLAATLHANDRNIARRQHMLRLAGLNVIAGSLRSKPSREGKYHSVTVTITCPDRERYDAVHAALRADPAIRWTI